MSSSMHAKLRPCCGCLTRWRSRTTSSRSMPTLKYRTKFSRRSADRGVRCAIGRAGVHVAECTRTQVKEAVCGYGAAHKKQVMRMTSRLLALDSDADDVADACAVAVCHHHRARLSALTGTRRRQA